MTICSYKANAFTSKEKIEGMDCIGNPAVIHYCENKFPDNQRIIQHISKEYAPITVFIKRNKQSHGFDVRLYNPDGSKVALCGHGLLAASKLVATLNVQQTKEASVYFDQSLLNSSLNCNKVKFFQESSRKTTISLPLIGITEGKEQDLLSSSLLKALNLHDNCIESIHQAVEISDYIFTLKDSHALRHCRPNFKDLADICKSYRLRCVFLTAPSGNSLFDYETRSFIPHSDINEDIVCGSSNCSIVNIWKQRFNKNSFKCFFPYQINRGFPGGVQEIKIENREEKEILISGEVGDLKIEDL